MNISTWWQRALGACLLTTLAVTAQAAGVSPALQQLARSFLEEHPAAQAARADLERAIAEARASGQPLYNPEIELDYEHATDNTGTVGVAQALDWTGKRRARDNASRDSVRAARAAEAAARQQLLGELLQDLGTLSTSSRAAALAQQRVDLLADFLDLAQRRYAAGDVGQTDVDLARLALAEARMQAASASADASAAESRLAALVPRPGGGWPALPALPENLMAVETEELLKRHPALIQARAEADAARASIEIARLDRRPDPVVGIRGGKEGDDTLVGVSVSIPLFVRNSFRAELDASNADAIRAEEVYNDRLRRARSQLQAAAQRYRLTRSALDYWENSGQSSLKGRIRLLKRLWETGEIGTTDYLVQLQQTLDTQASAVELEATAWDAWIAWLQAAGRTEQWLGL